jgi:hypothetical protein
MQVREFYYILTNGFGAHSRAPLFANHTNGAFKAFKGSDPLNKARGVQATSSRNKFKGSDPLNERFKGSDPVNAALDSG